VQLHGIRRASSHSGHGENSVGSENLHVLERCRVSIMDVPSVIPMPADLRSNPRIHCDGAAEISHACGIFRAARPCSLQLGSISVWRRNCSSPGWMVCDEDTTRMCRNWIVGARNGLHANADRCADRDPR
jgi:hypothetical protein